MFKNITKLNAICNTETPSTFSKMAWFITRPTGCTEIYTYLQGCGGILNGTIPSSGILQWSIYTAGDMAIQITFSDWTVSLIIAS